MSAATDRLAWLEAKAPILFLTGGALYTVFVGNIVLSTFAGTSVALADTAAWVAWVLILLGTLGLYPALVERRPYLARAAAGLSVVPLVCSTIVAVGTLVEAAGILSEAPGPLGLAPFVAIFTFYPVMALLGIAVLLTDVHPRAVGVLMLVLASGFPLFWTVLSSLPAHVSNGVDLVLYLGIGLALLTGGVQADGAEPAADPTA